MFLALHDYNEQYFCCQKPIVKTVENAAVKVSNWRMKKMKEMEKKNELRCPSGTALHGYTERMWPYKYVTIQVCDDTSMWRYKHCVVTIQACDDTAEHVLQRYKHVLRLYKHVLWRYKHVTIQAARPVHGCTECTWQYKHGLCLLSTMTERMRRYEYALCMARLSRRVSWHKHNVVSQFRQSRHNNVSWTDHECWLTFSSSHWVDC